MTEAAFALYLFTLALVCVSVYVCFRCIAWVVANGWRSMLGLVALRGQAVIEWQDCDVKTGTDWNDDEVEAISRLVRAVDEQPDDFALWENEIRERAS